MRPFVGRVQELADLASALEEAVSGRGSLVLLTGEPGIGKTRLMSEFARLAGQRGVRVVTGRCWEEGGAPPYWPWMQVVRSLGGDLEQLAARSDAHAGQRGAERGRAGGERIRLFDAVGRFLRRRRAERPLLVTLDDVHAADEPSLLLLRFLGDALAEADVLLVASYREAEKRIRELGDVFAELARVGRRMPLRGLTSADIEAYVGTVTGSRPTRQAVARLHEITGGNPFFVEEIVRLLVAGGTLEGLDEAIKDPVPPHTRGSPRADPPPRGNPDPRGGGGAPGRGGDRARVRLHLLQRASRLTPARLLGVLGEAAAVGVIAELPSTAHRYYVRARARARDALRRSSARTTTRAPPRRGSPARERATATTSIRTSRRSRGTCIWRRRSATPARPSSTWMRAGDRATALLAYEDAADHYRHALELLALVSDSSGHGAASCCCASATRSGVRGTAPKRG